MDKKITVVLADSTRARFFTLQDHRGQAGRMEPALVEELDLIQSGRRQRHSEALSESRPGTRQGGSGVRHAVDDHRHSRAEEGDRHFASEVVGEARRFAEAHKSAEILVVAPPRFVGHLKASKPPESARFVTLELSELSAPQALEHLTRHGHLSV